MHLSSIGVSESSALEVDDDEAAQLAMKKQQIDAIPFIADAEAALASDKSEIAAKFSQETFEMQNERFFNFRLGILIFEAEKFEHVRIFYFPLQA